MIHASAAITERRSCVRLAGGGKIDAVLTDQFDQPIDVLRDAEVVNVSAGGLALISQSPAPVGARMKVILVDGDSSQRPKARCRVAALDCHELDDHRHKIRCQLVEGRIPAELIYGW